MGAPPRVIVPQTCVAVSTECPVEGTLYGYDPSLGANAFFVAFFGLALAIQIVLGIKYKTWTYMIAVGLGCMAECGGYAGRILLSINPYDDTGFKIQIVLLIFAPAFLAAGIYLTLKHIVLSFGEDWSRLRPNWYTYIFIACDISSLLLQSAGGALAAMADPGDNLGDIGTDIMIAGIIWQVVILAVFGLLVLEYSIRTYKRRSQLLPDALTLWGNRRFRWFLGAVVVAYVTILVRCVYRIPELLGGWGGPMMRNEVEFIALEGIMIVLTVAAQTVFHPGFCFPALSRSVMQQREFKNASDTEMQVVGESDRA